ncbi:MAG TPA: hypothetical protein VKZ58_08300, partial [Longimicrobiales bacterium]|nr:hypothetical protein [Longimicrobiales bacterium]
MKSNPVAYLFLIGLALTFLGHGAMRVMLRDGQPVDPAPMDQLLEEMPEERDTTSGATWDLPVTLNRSVERWIEFLAGPNRERTALWLERQGRYGPLIRGRLRERGMPEDLLYLALIESGLSP